MKKPEPSDYLKSLRVVAVLGKDAEGVGPIKAMKDLYVLDLKGFMDKLHEAEKDHARTVAMWHKGRGEGAEAKPEAKPEASKPAVRDAGTDRVIAMCQELAASWDKP